MGLSVKIGSFAINTATGDQAITGVGFTPTVVLLSAHHLLTSDGTAAGLSDLRGVLTSAGQFATTTYAADGSEEYLQTAHLGRCLDDYNVSKYVAKTSLDADGFTVNVVTTQENAYVVSYVAIGGTDLTNAAIKEFRSPSSAQSQAYTGVGFQPTAVLLLSPYSYQASAAPSVASSLGCARGFWTASAAYACGLSHYSANSESVQKDVAQTNSAPGGYIRNEAALTSLDTDGFTLNWTTVTDSNDTYFYAVCLRGPQVKAGRFNQATSTGNQSVTGIGFQPQLVLFQSNGYATSTSIQTSQITHGYGAAISSSNRFARWFGRTAGATGSADGSLSRTKCIEHYTPGTPTLLSAADFVSMDSDGFTLNNTTVDATSREIHYLAIGAQVASGFKDGTGLNRGLRRGMNRHIGRLTV